jgi:hypothetical protein
VTFDDLDGDALILPETTSSELTGGRALRSVTADEIPDQDGHRSLK